MQPKTFETHSKFHLQHKVLLQTINSFKVKVEKEHDIYELLDDAYALRDILGYIDDLRKELEKIENMAHAKVGFAYTVSNMEENLQTRYCSATVGNKLIPNLPKRHSNPEAYDLFMQFFGLKPEFCQIDLFRLQWKNFMVFYNERISQGLPEIPGINPAENNPVYKLSIRKKRSIEFKEN